MVFQIIMLVCMLPIVPIIYVMLVNETKPKKNIILGVTLPHDAKEHPGVIEICSRYRRKLKTISVILFLIPIAFFFVPWFSVTLTLYLLWIDCIIVIPYCVYIKSNIQLKNLKKANNWYSEWSDITVIDTKAASAEFKKLSVGWLIPPVALSFIPIAVALFTQLHNEEFAWMLLGYGLNFITVAVFALLQRVIYHQKKESIDEDTEISVALTRIRQYNWSKFFLWAMYLTAAFSLLF